MSGKDKWLTAAMNDDALVVELLMRLKQSQASSPAKSSPTASVPLRWGVRQPRSRTALSFRCDGVFQRYKKVDSFRCSPTTPLSWSDGASSSATADGFEETSFYRFGPRSKVSANEAPGTATSGRPTRRKELATLDESFRRQGAKDRRLKRRKLDLNFRFAKNSSDGQEETTCRQPKQTTGSGIDPNPPSSVVHTEGDDSTPPDDCKANIRDPAENGVFLLPDLNMEPSEEFPGF